MVTRHLNPNDDAVLDCNITCRRRRNGPVRHASQQSVRMHDGKRSRRVARHASECGNGALDTGEECDYELDAATAAIQCVAGRLWQRLLTSVEACDYESLRDERL